MPEEDRKGEENAPLLEWIDRFWDGNHFDPTNIFTSLASRYRDGRPCVHGKWFMGSFHLCVRVVFDDGLDWIVRVPMPYRLLDRDGHTEREVAIHEYLLERTTIPVPELIAYGFGDARHPDLGPFMITKFKFGIPLTDWFKVRHSEETRLQPDIEEKIVRKVYRQAAAIMLELTSLRFLAIGTLAMSKEPRTWSITSAPWALSLHEAERNHRIVPQAANGPFESSNSWLSYIYSHHEQIIRGVPGFTLSKDLESLYRFREAAPRFISDSDRGEFRLHCDDFSAGNMLVDRNYNIVCLGDWEFTYTAPPEYQCCLASWLILSKPHTWSQEDFNLYSRQLDLFLQVLEEEEDRRDAGLITKPESRLSNVIRQGWLDGTFWFVLCAKSGLFFDDLWERFQRFDPVNFSSHAMETGLSLLEDRHLHEGREKSQGVVAEIKA